MCCIFADPMKLLYRYLFILALAWQSCAPAYYRAGQIAYTRYDIRPDKKDSSVQQLMAPYAEQINNSMTAVIGEAASTLEKKQPDNTLGYFMTDAFLSESKKVFQQPVDIALMNYGGIRSNTLQKGNIRIGTLYELMPFDNLLVLVTMNGQQLQQLLNHVAGRGGWPISGGSYSIQNKQAVDIRIGDAPLQLDKQYTVALSDYIANGGDDCSMLTSLKQVNKGYLQRDALIDYVKSLTAAGKKVEAPSGKRVSIL